MAAKKTAIEKKIDAAVRLLERHGYSVTPPAEPIIIDDTELKRRKLKKREQILIDMMMPYKDKYPSEMLNQFFNYWREYNKSLTKLRWEMEKTWSIELRLNTWYRNYLKGNRRNNGRQQITDADRAEKLSDILAGDC